MKISKTFSIAVLIGCLLAQPLSAHAWWSWGRGESSRQYESYSRDFTPPVVESRSWLTALGNWFDSIKTWFDPPEIKLDLPDVAVSVPTIEPPAVSVPDTEPAPTLETSVSDLEPVYRNWYAMIGADDQGNSLKPVHVPAVKELDLSGRFAAAPVVKTERDREREFEVMSSFGRSYRQSADKAAPVVDKGVLADIGPRRQSDAAQLHQAQPEIVPAAVGMSREDMVSFDAVKRSREWADTLRQSAVDTVAQTNPFINGITQAAEFAVNTAERFKVRYDNNCTLGDTQLKAAAAAVNLTLGDFVGYTTFLEGVLGVDSTTGELLGAGDRWLRGTVGAAQMIASAAGGAELIHAGRVALAGSAGATKAVQAGYSGAPHNKWGELRLLVEELKLAGFDKFARRKIISSFELETVKLRLARPDEFGLRYFDGARAGAKGHYLFETFPASRESSAIKLEWNKMTLIKQWKLREGAQLIEGRASAQASWLSGGKEQKFVINLDDLVEP